MKDILKPLKADSLVEVFISRFEHLIITGKIAIGQKLPSERELALQLGVSRPVVHEGLVDLAAKGLVTMKPRVGTVVNDYRTEGSLSILNSIINYQQGALDEDLLNSLLATRLLVETETCRLAAENRTEDHLRELRSIVEAEEKADPKDLRAITSLDFRFHHTMGMASGNLIYPLLINTFKPVYMNFTALFFSDPAMVPETVRFHRRLLTAIEDRNSTGAAAIMRETLDHGERHLRRILAGSRSEARP
ncbi:MAG TPA: FadR/GntR family transcriptional regulator [Deltaproteobacteria bacterium]|nr:FadR/GntR family transcriptional regulator [Deltaproteobacteria bacterium]